MVKKTLQDTLKVEVDKMILGNNTDPVSTLGAFFKGIAPKDKLMIHINGRGKFFFIVARSFDLERFEEQSGYLIVDTAIYNESWMLGFGIYNHDFIKCHIANNLTKKEEKLLRDLLDFTFLYEKPYTFYPGTKVFSEKFTEDGHRCYALYDYLPINRKIEPGMDDRMVRSLVFRTKDGKCPELTARLIALAAGKEKNFLNDPGNTVLIPIPASTSVAHEARFRVLCRELAAQLGITDGYSLLELVADREPEDVRRGMPLSSVMRLVEYNSVEGKDVLLLDDVYTTGNSFRQVAQYLMAADARSITGLFVAKTVERPAKQESKLF